MKFYRLAIFSVFLFLAFTVDEIVWSRDLHASVDKSSKNGKPVLIYFGASWCAPCKVIEQNVFKSQKFIDYSKKFEMVKIYDDYNKGEKSKFEYYTRIRDSFNVQAIPSFILIKAGKFQHVGHSYKSEELMDLLNKLR